VGEKDEKHKFGTSTLLSAGNLFFPRIFTDSVFAGKHSIPDTKHYCNNS
jgi:hypothetical protein